LFQIKSGADQRRRDRRDAGDNRKRQILLDALADQARARIGQPGHAGIRNQRHGFPGREPLNQLGGPHRLIVFVITDERLPNFEVPQQIPGMPGVFRRDEVYILQNLYTPVTYHRSSIVPT
jgi:hypothetical protein